MNDQEIVNTNIHKVACDGGGDGHPLIYLNIDDSNKVTCPYCNKLFVYRDENSAKEST